MVAILPTGGIELASTTSERRLHVASWLPLNAIENMLPNWGKVLHRPNRKPTFVTATAAPRSVGRAGTDQWAAIDWYKKRQREVLSDTGCRSVAVRPRQA